jgi:hypothetical protein
MKQLFRPRQAQKAGYFFGMVVSVLFLTMLMTPAWEQQRAVGPPNVGHENLSCDSCHLAAEGTMRQQLQANARHLIGLRASGVDFVHQPVTNDTCLDCHARPNDDHPVFRFNEPRFATARQAIGPQLCVSCHLEHEGQRVTIHPTYCSECHQTLELRDDPLTVSHAELIASNNWASCLGCHDYHGNHIMELETDVEQRLEIYEILQYFEGGPSPYSIDLFYQAKESRDE